MPWLKTGDKFATHPLLMRLFGVRGADDRTVNEVTGFVTRCAAESAGHMTDYRIEYGTAAMIGAGRHETLLAQAVEAGLLHPPAGKGARRTWTLVADDDLLQIRARDDVLWERQRQRDRNNKDLTMPVRLRDGDECRYCGVIVQWAGNKMSARSATYDHRLPGEQAKTPDDLFVACNSCNSARRSRENADELRPRRPAPARPYFSAQSKSLALLQEFFGPQHWISTYTNPSPNYPAAQRAAGGMEDHGSTESTDRKAEAYAPAPGSAWTRDDVTESTAPAWARPEQSPAGPRGREEAHHAPRPTSSGPRDAVRPRPVEEAHRSAGSTATTTRQEPDRKAAYRRRKRRNRDLA